MAGSVLRHWQYVVDTVPFWELVGIISAEIAYLRRRYAETGNHQLASALEDAEELHRNLRELGDPP